MISTNAATAIRRFASALTDKPGVQPNNAIPDAAQRWANALDLGTVANGLHLIVADQVHRSVFPLFARAQLQLGDVAVPRSAEVLGSTKEAFFKALGSVQVAERTHLSTVNDAKIGQLLMIEETIDQRWHPIPVTLLDQIAFEIEECRDLLNQLVGDRRINGLAHFPLLDALDWSLRGVRTSKNLEVLVGLGPALDQVRTTAETVAYTWAPALTQSTDAEAWQSLRTGFGVLSAAGVVLGIAGYQSPVFSVPAIATGVMGALEITDGKETLLEKTRRLVDLALDRKALPAAGGSSANEASASS